MKWPTIGSLSPANHWCTARSDTPIRNANVFGDMSAFFNVYWSRVPNHTKYGRLGFFVMNRTMPFLTRVLASS
jgi:hypothetical protein